MTVHEDSMLPPLHVFRFHVSFQEETLAAPGAGSAVPLCSGSFAECSGLEATVEPKVIKEGGLNYGAHQRVGAIAFGTVILKRGLTTSPDLWSWFELLAGGAFSHRMLVEITQFDGAGNGVLTWRLRRAMPTKFKAPDLNAKGGEIGVEELHLVHEGLERAPRVAMARLNITEGAA